MISILEDGCAEYRSGRAPVDGDGVQHRDGIVTISVVIATLNRDRPLMDTLEAVMALEPPANEIWVIDQTSRHDPATEHYLEEAKTRGCGIVRLKEPGVCFARNLGAALSRSEVILYLDDDILPGRPDLVARHAENYRDPEVQAVQGQILNVGQQPTQVGLLADYAPNNFAGRATRLKNFVTANASVRRSALLRVGGFDESFSGRTYANEDGDLGIRLHDAGMRIDFDPAASLLHLQAQSGGNRITGRDAFPEWTRSVTFFQFHLRHARGPARLVSLIRVFRTIALRRENALRPWLVPWALGHALYAFRTAVNRHRQGFKSSLCNPGAAEIAQDFRTSPPT